MSRFLRSAAMLVAVAAFAGTAHAQIYTQTIPEFSGPFHDTGEPFPFGPFAVGTFTGIPGGTILSATLSGTFGNSVSSTSAATDVYFGSLLVAQCLYQAPCWQGPGPTPWAFVFNASNFSALAGPTADLTAWQTSEFVIRLGPTTLDIVYADAAIPEPGSMALLATGLLGLVPRLRRKFRK